MWIKKEIVECTFVHLLNNRDLVFFFSKRLFVFRDQLSINKFGLKKRWLNVHSAVFRIIEHLAYAFSKWLFVFHEQFSITKCGLKKGWSNVRAFIRPPLCEYTSNVFFYNRYKQRLTTQRLVKHINEKLIFSFIKYFNNKSSKYF
jgi:hypothetical protein